MSDPRRTCVGCRKVASQRDLVRFRRRSDGMIVTSVGTRGRGRSAYLCPKPICFDRAFKRRSLASSLRSGGRIVGEATDLWDDASAALAAELALLRRTGGSTPSLGRIRALEKMRAIQLASQGGA